MLTSAADHSRPNSNGAHVRLVHRGTYRFSPAAQAAFL